MSLPTDDTLSLPVILAWLRVNSAKITLGGAIFALCAVPLVVFRAETFESTATLLVFPPAFKEEVRPVTRSDETDIGHISDMMPRVLPMELYKAIALSPPLMKQIIDEIPLENTGIRALQDRLTVELIQLGSRGAQGVAYTQALIFHAEADEPKMSATIANAWAQAFKKQVDELSANGVRETFTLLDTLHDSTKDELDQAELALAEHKKAWNVELLQAQLDAKQLQFTTFEDDLKKSEVDMAAAQKRLAALDEEASKEPEKKVYFRAPSDDAYWITGAEGDARPAQPEWGLRDEEVNEVYVEARKLALVAKEEMEGAKAKAETLVLKLDQMREEMAALSATLTEKSVERGKLSRESNALQASYEMVRAEYEKGRMAERTQASDIAISGTAVVPRMPTSPKSVNLVFAAFVIGMFVTAVALAAKAISEMAPTSKAGGGAAAKQD